MKVEDILYENECYETVWVDEDDNVIEEAAVRQWKIRKEDWFLNLVHVA